MSSFVGHAIASCAAYSAAPREKRWGIAWLLWLLVIALFPDLDYAVPTLRSASHGGIRVTHSLTFALGLPALTMLVLWARKLPKSELLLRSGQLAAAGLSHLVLDLLVGVSPCPLWWPLARETVRLPFGLLPSAGRINLANGLLYRNLAIELCALLPWLVILRLKGDRKSVSKSFKVALLVVVSLAGLWLGAMLER